MKIDVGMYCYNKTSRKLGIGKIISFQSNNNVNIKYKKDIELVSIGNVVASPDIIDLLEVGDVIKYRIDNVSLATKGYITGITDISDNEMLENIKKNKNFHILSIITHEQIENMSYKVGEK